MVHIAAAMIRRGTSGIIFLIFDENFWMSVGVKFIDFELIKDFFD
jgi:hypothetical protein